jgi:CHAT domain-containing protein
MGNVYSSQRQYINSLAYHQQALAIREKILGKQHPDVARSYNNIGITHQALKAYGKAISCHQQALTIRKQIYGAMHSDVASSYINLASAYMKLGLFSQAMEFNQQGLIILKQVYGEHHSYLGNTWNNMGENLYAQQQFSPAIEHYLKSLNAYLPNYATDGYRSLLSNSPEVLELPLLNLPCALQQRHAPGDDTLALSTVRFADRFIDSLRRSYTYENDKLQLGENANQFYPIAIDVAMWNKLDEEAFNYSEKNKAAVLAQSLNEGTALQLGGIPDSLLELDKAQRTQVTFYAKAIVDEELKCPKCDSTKLQQFKTALFQLNQDQKALQARLESDFPQYFALKYKVTKISVKELQQGFLSENPNSTLLEYLLGDTVLYAFCITKDSYTCHRQKLDTSRFNGTNALQLQVKKLNRALSDMHLYLDPTTVVAQPASLLYDYLIKPFEQQILGKDLIIIPDGELNKIPFELLIKPNPNLKNISQWQDLPYIIKQHNISYHYSVHLLLEEWQKSKTKPSQSSGFVAFAPVFQQTTSFANRDRLLADAQEAKRKEQQTAFNVFLSDQSTYPPLPGTEREVKAIYELFNQKNQPAKYYLNDQANEATVKSINLKPYKYLHFATHGLTDEDRPTNSCLILAQNKYPLPSPLGEGPGVGDNLLTSSEMYGLELDAELVVLSACQTGKGTLKAGEGIIGLTRGLLYAGARNLLVSQWNVNDASTAELMTKFYSKILAGQSNRQALRESKLELLNSKFACPHYWSAFVLVGR